MTLSPSTRILFASSEAEPFVKVGGLGDVAGSLPLAIHRLNQDHSSKDQVDIRLIIPFYDSINKKNFKFSEVISFQVPSHDGNLLATIYSTFIDGMTVYLVSGDPITSEPYVYGPDPVKNAEKFVFFSIASLLLPKYLSWSMNVLHSNDWHTSPAVYLLNSLRKKVPEYTNVHSVLSLHNLPYMGSESESALRKFNIPFSRSKLLPKWSRSQLLPMGLAAADRIVAVSPAYANEILTPEYGCGLQDFLFSRRKQIIGILNGLDYDVWNPIKDRLIAAPVDINGLDSRIENKQALQKEFHLEVNENIPLLIIISRMDYQKGIDIALKGLRSLKKLSWQVILLGTGDPTLESAWSKFSQEMQGSVRVFLKFDNGLAHRMYAGGDMLLMPSRYEPCGLSQMIAMRYGCIPVAHATGGLADSIKDASISLDGNGFLFENADAKSMSTALKLALSIFKNKEKWRTIQQNAMREDFSWNVSAKKYLNLYQSLAPNPK